MRQRRLPGKKIDTWLYRKGQIERKVPVRLVKDNCRGEVTESMVFCVVLDVPRVDLRDIDPNELRAKVFAELNKFYEVEWKPYLHIYVRLPSKEDVQEDELEAIESRYLSLSYDRVALGKTRDGRAVWCHKAKNEYDDYMHEGKPETGAHGRWEGGREMRSLVPETEENVAALKEIIKAIDAAGKKLEKLLSQRRVKKTLAQVVSKMLPFGGG